MATSPTIPENDAPEKADETDRPAAISRSSSPYDSSTKPGAGKINYNPSSEQIPGYRSGGTRTSKPPATPLVKGMQTTPSRNYVPRYSRQAADSNLDAASGTNTSPAEPEVPESDEVKAAGDQQPEENEPQALERNEPVYDEPPVEDNGPEQATVGNPAKNPAAGRIDKKASPSREEVADDEKAGSSQSQPDEAEADEADKLGRGYTGGGDANPKDIGKRGASLYRRILKTKARKAALGIPVGGGIIALFFVLFVSLAPLRLLNIVQNLENRFFASANHTMDQESEKLFEGYIKKRYFVMAHCGKTIDIECNPQPSVNPVTRMWKGWSHRRLEEKMANKFGVTFEYDINSRIYYAKFPGMHGKGANVNDFVTGNKELDEVIANSAEGQRIKLSRNQVRQVIRGALKDANLYDKTAYKYKFLQMMAEKYGLKFCVMFCKTKDAFSDRLLQRDAANLTMVERVQMRREQILQQGFKCIFALGPTCGAENKPKFVPCEQGVNCELGGIATTDLELSVQAALRASAASLGLENAAQLTSVKEFEDAAGKKGLSQEFIDRQVADIIGTKEGATKLIPIVGWISLAAQLIEIAGDAGPTVQHLSYLANTSMAASYFQSLATVSNECKSGHCNGEELSSFSDSFNHSPEGSKQGGTASAEESPLYNKYTGDGTLKGNPSAIKCENKKPPQANGLCYEEQMALGQPLLNDISATVKGFADGIIYDMAKAWNGIVGYIFKILGHLFGWILSPLAAVVQKLADATCSFPLAYSTPFGKVYVIPGAQVYCEIRDKVLDNVPKVIDYFQNHLVPSAFSLTMSGARSFNFAAAGANVLGNDTVHNVMGGVLADANTVARLQQEQYQQELADYQSQPLLKRAFDTQSQFSPVSKLAMATPSSVTDASYGAVNLFRNPFGSLSSSFASLFNKKAAAFEATPDPWGIPQYFVPDEVVDKIGTDQDKVWDKYCSDQPLQTIANGSAAQAYAGRAKVDVNSGEPVNPPDPGDPFLGVNPCLLISSALCPNSAFNDDMVCSSEDQNGNSLTPTTATGTDGTTGGTNGSTSKPSTGGYGALVSEGASFAGVDQGIDFVPSGSNGFDIYAPASGTIVQADPTGHHFDRTSGQVLVVLKLDQKPKDPNSSQYIYFIELIQISSSIHLGQHVDKGTVIGHNAQSPGIEAGWARGSGGPGSGLQPSCGLGGATVCGSSFDNWVKAGGGT